MLEDYISFDFRIPICYFWRKVFYYYHLRMVKLIENYYFYVTFSKHKLIQDSNAYYIYRINIKLYKILNCA